jgi:MATE family multidrug resistance protein
MQSAEEHPFIRTPHRSIIVLSIPATLSLVAEPITGMVDTAFIAQLGAVPLAALGIGATSLSTIFWIFNFLGISAQTTVAQALGEQNQRRASEISSLAFMMAFVFSLFLFVLFILGAEPISALLGAEGAVKSDAMTYLRLRAFGMLPMLFILVGFGVLRGLQDMRTPLRVAVGINLLNILLNGPLIFGFGPIPVLGVAGAALASTISQWIGGIWILAVVFRRLGFIPHLHGPDLRALLQVGGDLFVRTGLLTLFILLATRSANQINPQAGAAHQVIRTVWLFLALVMEGFAMTAQSLVGYFLGAKRISTARHAAALNLRWGLATGFAISLLMILATDFISRAMLPADSLSYFTTAWIIAALAQPLAALAFVTDGIHWGTGDYAYLRNGMVAATLTGAVILLLIDPALPGALILVWIATGIWLAVRSLIGVIRLWPGIGNPPLRAALAPSNDDAI